MNFLLEFMIRDLAEIVLDYSSDWKNRFTATVKLITDEYVHDEYYISAAIDNRRVYAFRGVAEDVKKLRASGRCSSLTVCVDQYVVNDLPNERPPMTKALRTLLRDHRRFINAHNYRGVSNEGAEVMSIVNSL